MKRASQTSFDPLLHLTYVLQQLSDNNLLEKAGVGLSQTRIMSVLNTAIPRSQRTIAFELQQTEANVSRQLKDMKRSGLVNVTKNKKDSRQRDVKLTAKGKKKFQAATKVLSAQQKNLMKLLDKKDTQSFDRATGNMLAALDVRFVSRRRSH